MKIMDKGTKFAHMGKPGTAFTPGFRRRLGMITADVQLEGKRILDVGCGEGVWLGQFVELVGGENVYGSEYDSDLVQVARNQHVVPDENVVHCPGENLKFEDNSFDVVFCHEVLEHVEDDAQTVRECIRVLRPGGVFIIFTPNRGWPFEQHGMFWRGKYIWGNIPLLPWIPFLHKRLAPHVRNYSWQQLASLFFGLSVKINTHTYVFPGFDRTAREKWWGRAVKGLFHLLEHTPLRIFGISHYVIVEKI